MKDKKFNEYEEHIKFFISNIKYFNLCDVEDFIYLSSLKLEDYTKKDNLARTNRILNELDAFSVIYLSTDLGNYAKYYHLTDKRIKEINKLAEMSYSFLKCIDEKGCKHPFLQVIKFLDSAKQSYDMFFSSFESMTYTVKKYKLNELFDKYYNFLNDEIETDERYKVDKILANSLKYDDKSLIKELSDAYAATRYAKVCQIDDPTFNKKGQYGSYNVPLKDGCNTLLVSNHSSKPIELSNLVNHLRKIKEQHGKELIADIDDEDEEEENEDDLYEELELYENYNKYDTNVIVGINTISDYGIEEEDATVGDFIYEIIGFYNEYKNYEHGYLQMNKKLVKSFQKRQDM